MDCIFCEIIAGGIPSELLYADDKMVIIKDIDPHAAKHYLAIPKRHYARFEEMNADDEATLGHMMKVIAAKQEELGLAGGYRLVINQGDGAGQTVRHLHVHILGGQVLDFPDLRK